MYKNNTRLFFNLSMKGNENSLNKDPFHFIYLINTGHTILKVIVLFLTVYSVVFRSSKKGTYANQEQKRSSEHFRLLLYKILRLKQLVVIY